MHQPTGPRRRRGAERRAEHDGRRRGGVHGYAAGFWSAIKPRNALQVVLLPVLVLLIVGWFAVLPLVTPSAGSNVTWNGGSLLLTGDRRASGSCTITPETGAQRTVEVDTRGVFRTVLVRELDPWFSGSATVRCEGDMAIRTGWRADLRALFVTSGGWIGFAVIAGVLVVGYMAVGASRTRH